MTSLADKPAISLSRIAIYAVLILAVLLYLVPLVVMLLTSFKTPEDISTGNLLSWPTVSPASAGSRPGPRWTATSGTRSRSPCPLC
jgi:ABC-type glycerol-3-phosphate transport system permease component